MSNVLLTLTGPSCAGKTTLMNELLKSPKYVYLRSFTTRDPRPGEQHGIDYNFISHAEARAAVADGRALQHVLFQGRDLYGTLVEDAEEIFASGRIPVVVVEPSGVGQFKFSEGRFGYKTLSIYQSVGLGTIVRRFANRICDDILLSGAPNQKTVDRMAEAIEFEHAQWPWMAAYDERFLEAYDTKALAVFVDHLVTQKRQELACAAG